MKRVKQLPFDGYEIKLGSAEKFMGMNIKDNSRFFYFSQPRMVEELLVQFNMEHCKPVTTSMDNNISYINVDNQLHQDVRRYREEIERLL